MPQIDPKTGEVVGAGAPEIDPNTGEVVPAMAPTPDSRNGIQRAFDDVTTVTPEQEKGHSWLTNKAQEFGAGAIQGFGAPFVHPIATIKGLGNTIAHPINTAEAVGSEAMEHPAQAIGNLVGGAVLGGAADAAGAPLLAKIPTRAKAGAMFQNVMAKAGDQPVWMQNSGAELNRALELADRGGTKPTTVSKLARRVGNVNNAPMNYGEARDFATNLSDLSADEKMALKPVMRRQVGKLSRAFNQDVGDAASRAGVGDQYTQAMRDYARASQLRNAATTAAKWAVPVAVGGGIASKLAHTLIPDR